MTFPFPFFALTTTAAVTYQTSSTDTTDAASYSFASQAIGNASSNRYVVVAIMGRSSSSANTISAVTIGGISATQAANGKNTTSGANFSELWIALVPTGTTATIAITMSQTCLRCTIGVWSVTGIASATPSSTIASTADPTSSGSLNVPARGIAIGCGYDGLAGTSTWSGITTKNFDTSVEAAAGQVTGASAAFATTQTGLTVSVGWGGGAGGNPSMVAASWGP